MEHEKVLEGRKPMNTTKLVDDNPLSFIVGALGVGTSQAIEASEAAGQQDVCQSDTLPTDGSNDPDWAKMGVIFGDKVEGDSIFRYCKLPPGWKKVPTDHSMWNNLVDARGCVRARFFYKAAFYDRSAHISTCVRFNAGKTSEEWERGDYDAKVVHTYGRVIDNGTLDADGKPTIVFKTEVIEHKRDPEGYEIEDRLAKEAFAWLEKNYPDFRNAAAYWED